MNHSVFDLGVFALQSGIVLPAARLGYRTYGKLNAARDNVVVLPTFYTGTHLRNEGYFGSGRAIDPARHFVVSVNMFGNGISSSPSNTPAPFNDADFPDVTLYDNVHAQYRLLTEVLRVSRVALVSGWSMAGCQAFHWATQYPDFVAAILPFCASARTAEHNVVFLEGVKAALQADCVYADGHYRSPPIKGLKAFARVYAGWAFSQTFYRQQMYRLKGFETAEALLQDWEREHLDWDANDLLCMLKTWQVADISANDRYRHDFAAALDAIRAKTIVIACDNDLYFRPEDNRLEIEHIPGGELRVFESAWGHCVASPGNSPEFQNYVDQAIAELLH